MTGRARLAIDEDRPVRHAVEIRHPSFIGDDFRSLAARWDVAVVVADTAGKWPMMLDPTSDLVYVRLHGDTELYTSGYSDRALDVWAARIRRWAREGRDVYVYFDNDAKVRAPFDALSLMSRLRVDWTAELAPPGPPFGRSARGDREPTRR
jgi:uncharacterized protein YecE (DUF72 family)